MAEKKTKKRPRKVSDAPDKKETQCPEEGFTDTDVALLLLDRSIFVKSLEYAM